MVKLIRLTSEDNCNFKANLDDGIQLTVNSKIALQNLTFNAEFDVLVIDATNREVKFTLNSNATLGQGMNVLTGLLTPRTYTSTEVEIFYRDLEGALNEALRVDASILQNGNVYGNFQVKSEKEKVEIKFKYTPVILFSNMNEIQAGDTNPPERTGETEYMKISQENGNDSLTDDTDPTDKINLSNLSAVSVAHTSNRTRYISPQGVLAKWSAGSAIYMVRVENLVDHAGLNSEHGFGVGLSFNSMASKVVEEIETTDRDFEILVEKTDMYYRYISPTNPHQEYITDAYPYAYDDNVPNRERDHIVFERKAGVITGCIWNTSDGLGNGVRTELFSYKLSTADRHRGLYPYIYMKAGGNNATAGRPSITMDSLTFIKNTEFEGTGQQQAIGTNEEDDNVFQDIATLYSNLVPTLNNELFSPITPALSIVAEPQFNGDILRFIGYSDLKYPANILYKFTHPDTILSQGGEEWFGFILIPDGLKQLVNSDNFIVILDSNPLFSYDASRTLYGTGSINSNTIANRGRRVNILATIPKNDNSGSLEYEPNQLTFIDFDLSVPQNLKNISVRVLDKNFGQLRTFGLSIMTLLIEN
jgi:hypothetical protein|tara:strand:- start:469 stop:2235 length:1767 start_codon:yes stop_codon:yes gene_type:complete